MILLRIFAAFLAGACSAPSFDPSQIVYNKYNPHETPGASPKTCTTLGIGLDLLHQMLQKNVEQYVGVFNDNQHKNIQDVDIPPVLGNYTIRITKTSGEFGAKPLSNGHSIFYIETLSINGQHRSEWGYTFKGSTKL